MKTEYCQGNLCYASNGRESSSDRIVETEGEILCARTNERSVLYDVQFILKRVRHSSTNPMVSWVRKGKTRELGS